GNGAEAASSEAFKSAIGALVEAEDRSSPLSDQKIASLLAAQGLQVARRTVAKYREQMGILPAALRKRF
ncbi:MAG: RNA polymerase sigma-54 factor, partial [Fibrobacterales bacterium]|nr:RNA polymerase sigma-54 factor [Fibrobacterales bacterium]